MLLLLSGAYCVLSKEGVCLATGVHIVATETHLPLMLMIPGCKWVLLLSSLSACFICCASRNYSIACHQQEGMDFYRSFQARLFSKQGKGKWGEGKKWVGQGFPLSCFSYDNEQSRIPHQCISGENIYCYGRAVNAGGGTCDLTWWKHTESREWDAHIEYASTAGSLLTKETTPRETKMETSGRCLWGDGLCAWRLGLLV